MREKSVKKNVILNLLRHSSTLFFPLLTFSYVARVLSPNGLGGVTYARTITNYFVLFAMLGVNLYGIREVAKVKEDKELRTKITYEILCINMVSTLIALCIFLFMTFTVSALSDKRQILLVFMMILLFRPLGLDWFFGGIEEYSYITKRTILIQLFSLLAMICFVKTPQDALHYAGVLVISEVGANIFNIIYAQKFLTYKRYKDFQIVRHIKPMLFLAGTVFSQQIYAEVDSLMLGMIANDSAVGLYAAATKLSSAVIHLLIAICVVSSARVAFYYNSNSSKKDDLIIKTFNYLVMLALPVTVGLELLGKEAILIFCGNQYLATATTVQIIAPEIFVYVIVVFIQYLILNPIGKEKISFYITGAGALINIVGNLILIPILQERGAAISTVLTKVSMLIIGLYYVKRFLTVPKVWKFFGQYAVGSVIIIGICVLIKSLIDNVYICCGLCVVISAIIYFTFLILVKNPYVLELLNETVAKIKTLLKKSA